MRRRMAPLALLAMMAFTLPFAVACEKKTATAPQHAAWSSIPSDKASALIDNGGVDLLLDVRTPEEFATGALPNAMSIPVDALGANLEKLAPYKDKTTLVYCRSGRRSAAASQLLAEAGFTHVLNLDGGILAWEGAGLAVEKR
ncbi:MAG: rhodanese-like domain-containing protein [Nitrospinae bacterium]|nr:rhodanese-like domain-containing protein [Nitrospinota bacterium]